MLGVSAFADGQPHRRFTGRIRKPRWCGSTAQGVTANAARPAASRSPPSTPPPRPQHARVAEKMIRKLRAGMMPPPGARRPDEPTLIALADVARDADRQGGAGHTQSGLAAVPAAQSRRVRARGEGSARARRRRQRAAAARHDQPGLRQRRRLAGALAGADGRLPARGEHGDRAGGRRSGRRVERGALPRAEDGVAAAPRRRRAVRHARRHRRSCTPSPPTATTCSASSCTATPTASCSAARPRASRSSVSINGERKALLDIDPSMAEVTTSLFAEDAADPRRAPGRSGSTAAFIQRFDGPVNDLIAPIDHTLADTQIGVAYGITTLPHLKDLSDRRAAARDRRVVDAEPRTIFTCRPTDGRRRERPCASQIVTRLATQAFRRPASRRDIDALMRFYADGRKERDFESGVAVGARGDSRQPAVRVPRRARRRVAAARSSRGDARAGGKPARESTRAVSDVALASRLSFFLWATAPDAELTTHRRAGTPDARRACSSAGRAAARGSARRIALDPVRGAVAAAERRRRRCCRTRSLYPYYDHTLGDALRPRDRALLREHRPRRSQRARPADRRLLVRQRADRAALRHPERHRHRRSAA